MSGFIAWIVGNKAVVLGVLFFLSEALALIPGIGANSVFQLVFGWIADAYKALVGSAPPAAPPAAKV
jgi:hypothetical protein